jgi:light-regulated signal transduction histidine kinase (bacteriophytochrome)
MYAGQTLFAQLMKFVPWTTFARLVERYGGDHRVRTLTCAEQYRAMAFAQLTYRDSLRDIETCLSGQAAKLYHTGFRQPVRRSTLAAAAGRVVITVDDEGPGTPRSEREKVFEPFYRIGNARDPSTGGVGLGLSVTRSIVWEHGGRITLGARKGGGLSVGIELPISLPFGSPSQSDTGSISSDLAANSPAG